MQRGFICLLLLFMLLLMGCTVKPDMEIYSYSNGATDSMIIKDDLSAYEEKKAANIDAEIVKKKQFSLWNTEYRLSFTRRETKQLYSKSEDIYRDTNGAWNEVHFWSGTDDFCGCYSYQGVDILEGLGMQLPNDSEGFEELAKKVVSEYFEIDDCEVTCKTEIKYLREDETGVPYGGWESYDYFYLSENEDETAEYTYEFVRSINGFKTADAVTVTLTDEGKLRYLFADRDKRFNKFKRYDINRSEIENLVKERILSNASDGLQMQIKDISMTVCCDSDDNFFILAIAKVTATKGSRTFSDSMSYVIELKE